ncbi:MAG: diguanylate cyclase domain-containing protein, partial [Terracidiphilus sp.]
IQQTGVKIKVLSLAGIKVLKPAAANPWTLPFTPLGRIITAYHIRDLSRRIHVHGVITYYLPGTAAVLENGSSSLWIATDSDAPLRVGDLADAIGFPDTEDHHLSLVHAEIRDSGVYAPIQPYLAKWEQIGFWAGSTLGGHEYDLVSTEGRVVTEVREAAQDEYVLTSGKRLLTAIYHHPPRSMPLPPMYEVPLGSTIKVTGICTILDSNPDHGEASFNILLRSFRDIDVIAQPSLLNVRDLIYVIGLLFVVVILVGARIWLLERKVRRETMALAYLERRRSRILEQINNARPVAEIVEQITEVVSFRLRGAPCWCQLADGACIGNKPPKFTSQQIIHREIPGRPGTVLGVIYAALDSLVKPGHLEEKALSLGSELTALAIEAAQLYSDLVHRSEFDLLTDVQNRFSLERGLNGLIQSARQSHGVFGLVYIDLNEFKQVNDLYGHHVGDQYLQEVALRMKRQLRPGDALARLGGDEFAVLIPEVHSRAEVDEVAQRLERCFDEPFTVEGYVLHGSTSIGIALFPEDGDTSDSLLSAADAAMYEAKHAERENGQAPDRRGTAEPALGSRG